MTAQASPACGKYLAREIGPTDVRRAGKMVDAGIFRALTRGFPRSACRPPRCRAPGSARRSDPPQWSASRLCPQPQHCLDEIGPMRRQHPGRAQDRMDARPRRAPPAHPPAWFAHRPPAAPVASSASRRACPCRQTRNRSRSEQTECPVRHSPRHRAGASALITVRQRLVGLGPVDRRIGRRIDHRPGAARIAPHTPDQQIAAAARQSRSRASSRPPARLSARDQPRPWRRQVPLPPARS